ncbi:MAG: CBS domain-containing protein [Leptolyngbyaceae cyanobacterium MO_188.B28]|nr:CBS domain-containing protein [Leptolyngbyaceae cyanobacterium MO_188.B28]
MFQATDIMTEEVFTISSSATVAQAIALMQEKKVRSLIVDRAHDLDTYGILTERDIIYNVTATGRDPNQMHVNRIMRKPCIVVKPNLNIQQVAQLFADTGIQRAPVIQEGELLGIISVTDILMKSDLRVQSLTDALSRRIQEALRHAQVICGDEQEQISHDCAVAWDVVEELQAEAAHRSIRRAK